MSFFSVKKLSKSFGGLQANHMIDLEVEEGEIRENMFGKTLHVAPEYDHGVETDIADWFEQFYSIRFRNYPVADDYLHSAQQIACNWIVAEAN